MNVYLFLYPIMQIYSFKLKTPNLLYTYYLLLLVKAFFYQNHARNSESIFFIIFSSFLETPGNPTRLDYSCIIYF